MSQINIFCAIFHVLSLLITVEESIKRKAGDEETPVVPEKKAKTDDVEVEAEVVEKVTA